MAYVKCKDCGHFDKTKVERNIYHCVINEGYWYYDVVLDNCPNFIPKQESLLINDKILSNINESLDSIDISLSSISTSLSEISYGLRTANTLKAVELNPNGKLHPRVIKLIDDIIAGRRIL